MKWSILIASVFLAACNDVSVARGFQNGECVFQSLNRDYSVQFTRERSGNTVRCIMEYEIKEPQK